MKIQAEVTITLTLTAEEAVLICAALGSHQRMKANVYSSAPITPAEVIKADEMRDAIAVNIPESAHSQPRPGDESTPPFD